MLECWGAQGGAGYTGTRSLTITDGTVITSSNVSQYFARSNGSYYFTFNSSNNAWEANNLGNDSSTASTTWTCAAEGYYKIDYSYITESNYDKLTLTINGNTILNNLSGTGEGRTDYYHILSGGTIIATYTKDGSNSAAGEKVCITITKGSESYSGNFTLSSAYAGGKGGYAKGTVTLDDYTTIYCYTGGQGVSSNSMTAGSISGGFNGGGRGNIRFYQDTYTSGGSGGGASDIRIKMSSLYYRVIVAGGGGGAAGLNDSLKYGGGISGGCNNTSYVATQTSAGTGGSLGQGGHSNTDQTNYKYGSGGGGGGWYGGGAQSSYSDSASNYREQNGGGSGLVYTAKITNNYLETKYFLKNTTLTTGNASMPSPASTSTTTVGRTGNGYIRITILSLGYPTDGTIVVEQPNAGSTSQGLYPGYYKLECWGSQGGNSTSYSGGRGGYSVGTLFLKNYKNIFLKAGGYSQSNTNAGYNGGGSGILNGAGGGGASDIRIGSDSLYSRVIVAGGGGGAGVTSASANPAGCGGGLYGGDGYYNNTTGSYTTGSNRCGGSASQTAGGKSWSTQSAGTGTFGQGGNASGYSCGGGGGGWYGGGGAYDNDSDSDGRWGGGGSGYVYTSSTASSYPTGCLLTSDYYLTNAQTIAGNTSFTSPTGVTETGHTGNGYVRITTLNVDDNILNTVSSSNCFVYNLEKQRYETNTPTELYSHLSEFNGTIKKNLKITLTFDYETNLKVEGKTYCAFWLYINNASVYSVVPGNSSQSATYTFSIKAGDKIRIECINYDMTNISGVTSRQPYFSMTTEELSYLPVQIPSVNTFDYDGSKKYFITHVVSSDTADYKTFYTFAGGTGNAINAGTYTSTLSLIDKTNTKWSDGTITDKVITWTINKIQPKFSYQSPHFLVLNTETNLVCIYGGDKEKILVTSGDEDIISITNTTLGFPIIYTVQAKKLGKTILTISNPNEVNYFDISYSFEVEVVNNPFNLPIIKGQKLVIPMTTSFGIYTGDIIGPLMLPKGKYHLECWGAQGGLTTCNIYTVQNKGGYADGILNLLHKTPIYVGVGSSGLTTGFNGGGKRQNYPGGGGASDIRIGANDLYARVLVAGGGGSEGAREGRTGGAGGGIDGTACHNDTGGYGGEINGVKNNWIRDSQSNNFQEEADCYGGFGFGGNGITVVESTDTDAGTSTAAGGGGWYGGSGVVYTYADAVTGKGGGGGSNYFYDENTSMYYPSGCLLTPEYYLIEPTSFNGQNKIPDYYGINTMYGNEGDGVVIITVLDGPTREYIKENNEWYYIKEMYVKNDDNWEKIEDIYFKNNEGWI